MIRFGGTYDDYVAADFADTDALHIEILKEKFCLVIGLPTFHDINRTNNMIGTTIKNENQTTIPQRFLYPSTEAASNDNAPEIVDFFQPTQINQ